MNHLIPLNPFAEFDNFFRSGNWHNKTQRSWEPAVDISETKDGYVIHAELPAVKKEDIALHIDKGMLILKGERCRASMQEGQRFHRLERSYGNFQRVFAVPDGVDESHLDAEYADGVLTINIKKIVPKPAATIEIKTA